MRQPHAERGAHDTGIARWYDEFYRQRRHVDPGPWYRGVASHLEAFAPRIAEKSLVEVGCGAGEFVAAVPARRRVGVELSEEAALQSRERGVAVVVGTAEHLPLRSAAFDIVICCEVLEHVCSVEDSLAEIARVTQKGGLLLCSTPNYLNVPWLVLRLMADVLGKKNWTVRQPIDRLFTSVGIRRRLRAASYDVIAVEGWVMEPPGWWHLRRRRGAPPHRASGLLGHLALHPVFAAVQRDTSGGRQRTRRGERPR